MRAVVLVLLTVALALAPGLPAEVRAQATPSVEVIPATAAPGETISLRGSGWPAGASLGARLYLANNVGGPGASMAGQIVVGPDGTFVTSASVPLTLFGQGSRGNLNVVPGAYTLVVSQDTRRSIRVPFTVGAPAQAALLWGEVAMDLDGNGVRDARDRPTSALVTITPASGQSAPVQAMTDALGRFVVSPMPPGAVHLEARVDVQNQPWQAGANVSA